jgi:hypothetical protein
LSGSYSGGVGALGGSSGIRRVSVYTRLMVAGDTTFSVQGTGFADTVLATYLVKGANGATPGFAVAGGNDNTAGTAYSITTGALDVTADDVVLTVSAINSHVAQINATPTFTLAGATFSEILPNGYKINNAANYIEMTNWSARVSAGAGSAPLTFAATFSATSVNYPAGATAVIRLRGVPYSMDGQQPGGGCGGMGKKGGDGAVHIWGIV